MQTFILAAERVGLGCCPISVIRNHLSSVVQIIHSPPGAVPVAGLTPREKQRDPNTFEYAEFYGWSEDKVRQAQGPEGSEFGRMVREHGFTLD